MLTTRTSARHRALLGIAASIVLLGGCSARPVLHEFPRAMLETARPEAAVGYTLRARDRDADAWQLRGEQGDLVGEFRWKRAFREPVGTLAPDRSEDFRREDIFQNSVSQSDYIFRLSATNGNLKRSTLTGTAPPHATIFAAASGERVGELELRAGFDLRFEGDWNGRQVFWRVELADAEQAERDTDEGAVLDSWPEGQLMRWVGGSTAGVTVFVGREVTTNNPASFGEFIFDIQAGRPLTRRELADVVTLLFAIRGVQEAAVLVNTVNADR